MIGAGISIFAVSVGLPVFAIGAITYAFGIYILGLGGHINLKDVELISMIG